MKKTRIAVLFCLLLLLLPTSCGRSADLVIDAEYNDPVLLLTSNVPMDTELLAERITLEPDVPVMIEEKGETCLVTPLEAWPEESRIRLTIQPFSMAGAVLDRPFTFIFQTPPPPGFDLVAVGDVMLDYLTSRRLRHYDPAYPFACIAPVLRQGDLVFANLECPISDRGTPMQKTFTFRAPPFAVDALIAAGINLVSLANNHILDYGTDALIDTLDLLEEHDIAHAGAGRDEASAREAATFEINGIKIAVLAYCQIFYQIYPAWRAGPEKPGMLHYGEREQFIADIEKAREWADVVVVSLHFGDEYTYRVNSEQREAGRLAVDSGADLVLGHHSHAPQGIEIYGGKPIIYSLGNFLFYPFAETICNETYILQARIGKGGVERMRLLPVILGDSRPCRAAGEEAVRLRTLLTGLLDELGTSWDIDGESITIQLDP